MKMNVKIEWKRTNGASGVSVLKIDVEAVQALVEHLNYCARRCGETFTLTITNKEN